MTPKPVQKPYPPIRIAANSPDSFALAGKQGMAIFASPLINPPAKLREYLAVHRDTLPSGVKQDIALAFPVHVADSRGQARRECEESLMHFFAMAREVLKPLAGATIKSYEAYTQLQDRLERVSYEGVEKIGGIFGDPAYCIERVKALQEEFQTTEFICYFNQGGLVAPATVKRSMELFATKVMPVCR